MTEKSSRVQVFEAPASVAELRVYLRQLQGAKILTVEESTASQWLYSELREEVDQLLVCDPYRNHLLREGAKTDKIDARKLVHLLRANLLKPVFHSGDHWVYLRKLVSGYRGIVQAGVRLKNQRAALFLSQGKHPRRDHLEGQANQFVLEGLERSLEIYEEEKTRYEGEFRRLSARHRNIQCLKSLPGIGEIGAVKIVSLVVQPRRFKTANHFLSYCGLVKLDRMSGGTLYGRKSPRCCRTLKGVFKNAALTAARNGCRNPMRDYYQDLVEEKHLPDHVALHAVSRRIARLAYGILKTQQKYDPHRRHRWTSSQL
jgi:transposase